MTYELGERTRAKILDAFHAVQVSIKSWVEDIFGADTATSTEERVLRFLEEAIEVAQAYGVSAAKVRQVRDYVYSRPAGEPQQEIAGSFVTLFALCGYADVDAGEATLIELNRIMTPDMVVKMRDKQAFKRSEGLTHDAPLAKRKTLEELRMAEDNALANLEAGHPGKGSVCDGKMWGHLKSGDLYCVENVITEEETGEPMVCYRPVSKGESTKMPTFARPLKSFLRLIPNEDGTRFVQRFAPVTSKSVLMASDQHGGQFEFSKAS